MTGAIFLMVVLDELAVRMSDNKDKLVLFQHYQVFLKYV